MEYSFLRGKDTRFAAIFQIFEKKKMNRNMDSPSLRFTLFKSGSNRITSWRQPQL